VHIAKDGLDIGLLTTDPAMVAFFRDTVGLGAPEELPITPQVMQHRFAAGSSVIKINVAPAVGTARSGYRGIAVAREVAGPVELVGPDDSVTLAPSRDLDGAMLAIRMAVPDLDAARAWFVDVLGWEATAPDRVRVGTTRLLIEPDPATGAPPHTDLVGWTYLTVQIPATSPVAALVVPGVNAPIRDLGSRAVRDGRGSSQPARDLLARSHRSSVHASPAGDFSVARRDAARCTRT
jgi:hypothetical protein